MKVNPAITVLNGGELSPLIEARPELEKYQAGLRVCQNVIPRVEGGGVRRGGTRFTGEVKDSSDRTWQAPFIYSATDAFVLEFGDGYVRFVRDRGVLEVSGVSAWDSGTSYAIGDLVSRLGVNYYCKAGHTNQQPPNATYWHPLEGSIYEIPSPYGLADLTDEEGLFRLRFEQSGDILYITDGLKRPRKLTRHANTRWIFTEFEAQGGPFKEQNIDKDVTVYASAATGTVTLTASAPIFSSARVGGLFLLEMKDGRDVKPWAVYQEIAVNDKRRSDGKYYRCTAVGEDGSTHPQITGVEKPIHTEGRYWDGDGLDLDDGAGRGEIGAEWEFLHAGYGWAIITGYSTDYSVTATVLSQLPEWVVDAGNATWRWAFGAWSDAEGWPDNVCFFRERLSFFLGRRMWASAAGDFENFRQRLFGEVLPESALSLPIESGRGDLIKWVAPSKRLLFGTGGAEGTLGEQTTNQVFAPGNTKSDMETGWGSRAIAPCLVGQKVIYVEKSGRAIREFGYSLEDDGFTSLDLTIYARHLFPRSAGIEQMAFQQHPHNVIWGVRSDGLLLGMTYNKQENVSGWHRQPVSGVVESVCTIPSPDGARDDVWLIVRRTIDGVERRYKEWITPEYEDGDDRALVSNADSHLVYNGSAASTITGLDHLEGQTVSVKVNGAAHPDRVVEEGSVTLEAAFTKVCIGLLTPGRLQFMPVEAGAQVGTPKAKTKRIHGVTLSVVESLGGKLGPSFDEMDRLQYRRTDGSMDQAPDLFTGDVRVAFPGGYNGKATICLELDQDQPFTLTAVLPEMATYEG